MSRSDVLKKLKAQEPELRRLGLGALYLFGSVARDERRPKDVDLLFEIGDAPSFSLLDQASAAIRLEEILGRPVDLVQRSALHDYIKPKVEAEMVRIF